MPPKAKSRYGVNSVNIAMRMLKVVSDFRRPVLLSEVARELHVSPGKVHRYFVSLLDAGVIAKQPETGKYELGAFALHVGLSALEQIDAVRFASEGLPGFRDDVALMVLLAVWSEVGPVVIRIEETKDRVKMNVRVGSVLPVATSAIGRVFMSYLPAKQADALVRKERRQHKAVATMALDEIKAGVIRDRASRIDSFGLPGVAVLAAPILDHQDSPAAVVAVLSLSDVDELAIGDGTYHSLMKFAHQIGSRLGNRASALALEKAAATPPKARRRRSS